ncbi:MAG: NAD(+) synthase [Rikenellaceae bacterium]
MRKGGYFRVATAAPFVKIGDVQHNCEQAEVAMCRAEAEGVEVLLLPELSVTGYTCADLFLQSELRQAALDALEQLTLKSKTMELTTIVGVPIAFNSALYNCAAVISKGEVLGLVPKTHIPNYSEFYEARWFASGSNIELGGEVVVGGKSVTLSKDLIFEINGARCAIEICEDLWVPMPPSSSLSEAAEVIFNLSASPEVVGKNDYLRSLIEQQSARCLAAYVYSSAGFGESSTDLVFAGNGIVAENGRIIATADRFSLEEQMTIADIDIEALRNKRLQTTTFHRHTNSQFIYRYTSTNVEEQIELLRPIDKMPFVPSSRSRRSERCQEIFSIQTNGLAQRLNHIGAEKAIIGISGGLDSTLALLVTVKTFDRLGLNRKGIIGVTMPGFGTTGRTYNNAINLMMELGVTIKEISIKDACIQHFNDIGLDHSDRSVAYENSQARERTQILMDLTHIEGGIVVGTGDLSEIALGWATYNGDHMSMYGVNASVPKTLIRYLVEWFADSVDGSATADILRDVADTPISPELLPADENDQIAQKTEDLVGPYELHDFFLYNFVRMNFAPSKIYDLAARAFVGEYDTETIKKWLKIFVRRFFNQQFKRSAMPDGPKVGSVSLSPRGDWRMPSDATAALWLSQIDNI